MTLRVLQVYPKADSFTGAAIQLRELAEGLARRGHRVVVATRPGPEWAAWAHRAGVPHVGVPLRHAVDLPSALGLRRLIREHAIQVVHAHKGLGRTLLLWAGLVGPLPPLVVNRGVSFPLSRWSALADRSRRVARIVAVAESIKAGLVTRGVPAGKIEVIYSGTDTERFDPGRVDGAGIRRELSLDPGAFLITQIGIRSWKGNDDVLEAFARVHATEPGAHLLLVGAKPGRRRALEARAERLGLGAAVTVWGYRTDVPEILAATDLTVDASYAGLGLTGTLRESLAMQTPVVATRVEGNPELVRHEVTGLLVPPRDPEALAAAILRLMADPFLARTLGQAGRKLVLERFSTRIKLERLEALYREILGGGRCPQPNTPPGPSARRGPRSDGPPG